MNLVVCPSCHRHVRANDAACPFCRTAAREALMPAVAAAMLLGVGFAVSGCSSSNVAAADAAAVDGATTHASSSTASVTLLYGPPPCGSGGPCESSSSSASVSVTLYGPPPPCGSGGPCHSSSASGTGSGSASRTDAGVDATTHADSGPTDATAHGSGDVGLE